VWCGSSALCAALPQQHNTSHCRVDRQAARTGTRLQHLAPYLLLLLLLLLLLCAPARHHRRGKAVKACTGRAQGQGAAAATQQPKCSAVHAEAAGQQRHREEAWAAACMHRSLHPDDIWGRHPQMGIHKGPTAGVALRCSTGLPLCTVGCCGVCCKTLTRRPRARDGPHTPANTS
jgi:hypothetical protein